MDYSSGFSLGYRLFSLKEDNKKRKTGDAGLSYEVVDLFRISDREKKVSLTILKGKTNSEMAQEKFIEKNSEETYLESFAKIKARNRVELVNILRTDGKSA